MTEITPRQRSEELIRDLLLYYAQDLAAVIDVIDALHRLDQMKHEWSILETGDAYRRDLLLENIRLGTDGTLKYIAQALNTLHSMERTLIDLQDALKEDKEVRYGQITG